MGMTGEQAYALAKKLIEASCGGGGTVDAYTKAQTDNLLIQKADKTSVDNEINELNSNLSNNSFGKLSGSANLFKPKLINVWQSNCVIDSNDKITLTSTGTSGVAYARIGTLELKANTEYTFNILEKSGDFENIQLLKDNKTIVKIIYNSTTFTPTEDMNVTVFGYVKIGSDKNCNFKLMVSTDGIHTAYEPYIMSNKQLTEQNESLGNLNLFGNAIIGKRWNGLNDASRAQIKIKVNPNETYTIKVFDNPNSLSLFGFQSYNDSDGTSGIAGTDISLTESLKTTITTKSNCKYLLLNIACSSTMTSDLADSFKAMVVKGDTEPTEYYDFSGANGVIAKDLADINNSIDELKNDLEKLRQAIVSLGGTVS